MIDGLEWFSRLARTEAIRFSKDGVVVEPFVVTTENILLLTLVDGAVILDSSCVCYAFGVILDGVSSECADSSRGSRYNSSLRYFESKNDGANMIIAVKSDDGMLDMLPRLMPRIDRQVVRDAIDSLAEVVGSGVFSYGIYKMALDELHKYRFYLSDDDCVFINSKIEVAAKLVDKSWSKYLCSHGDKFQGNYRLKDGDYFL